jgi:hypothetical protein
MTGAHAIVEALGSHASGGASSVRSLQELHAVGTVAG